MRSEDTLLSDIYPREINGNNRSIALLRAIHAIGLLSPELLKQIKQIQAKEGVSLIEAIHKVEVFNKDALYKEIASMLDIEYRHISERDINSELLKLIPQELATRKLVLPLTKIDNILEIATPDPFDASVLEHIQLVTGLQVKPVLVSKAEIERIITRLYGVGADSVSLLTTKDGKFAAKTQLTKQEEDTSIQVAQEAGIIKLVDDLITEAIKQRASDIHIEPYENLLKIRYRIDGMLYDAPLPAGIHFLREAIINRIKILSNLSITEKRLPQDGRFEFRGEGPQKIDIRVSIIPMAFGEGIVMRLLYKSNLTLTLSDLGMENDTLESFQSLIRRPYGIILVTGPTGSGKSTTLYAAIREILNPHIKIITVEDPVEYHLDGVCQIPIETRVGMTFDLALRSILRHDPDVIMVGEIRDMETAHIATQAALTGHLVLSTLHTNDACSAPTRLIDMGVEPYLVSASLIGVMAQRLVRRVCEECKQQYQLELEDIPEDSGLEAGTIVWKGLGCNVCYNTGYKGRIGIFELLKVNEEISRLIVHQQPAREIVKLAKQNGLRLLREDGWLKVRKGITTIEEVLRCTAS